MIAVVIALHVQVRVGRYLNVHISNVEVKLALEVLQLKLQS